MNIFKGKRYNIQHTHYMGKAGQLSSGGGKTKEFLEWEENLDDQDDWARAQDWEQELEKMQSEKDIVHGEYLDTIIEQQQELVEAEREKIRQKHRMDCIYLRKYGMTMDECREHYKDNPGHDCHKKNDYDGWWCKKENPIADWDTFNNVHIIG